MGEAEGRLPQGLNGEWEGGQCRGEVRHLSAQEENQSLKLGK